MKTLREMMDLVEAAQQPVAEVWTKLPSGDYQNSHTGVRSSKPPVKKKRGEKTGAEWDAIEKAKKDKEPGVAEGSSGKIQPGDQIRVPDYWNKFDVVSEIAKKYGILTDVEYSYDTRKWTITKTRPMTAQDEKQMYTINGGIPQVDEQGVAEEQLEETTPEAMTKVERLFRS